MSVIEAELRSFISDEQYMTLCGFFDANAELVKEDTQETGYFDCAADLRIQRGAAKSKIWLKKGAMHDAAREEIEIAINPSQYDGFMQLFEALGYNINIMWFRHRREYRWNGISVMLDDTRGYGKIIEFEKLTDTAGQDSAVAELQEKMAGLGIALTPAEEFARRFEDYKANWRTLTKTAA